MTYIGHNMFLGGASEAADHHWLKSNGITAVLNCAYEIPDFYPGEFVYKRLDLNDAMDVVSLRLFKYALDPGAAFIDHHKKRGRVLIHCAVGKSRSAGVLIYYLSNAYKSTPGAALKYLQKYRPIVDPNPGFKSVLSEMTASS